MDKLPDRNNSKKLQHIDSHSCRQFMLTRNRQAIKTSTIKDHNRGHRINGNNLVQAIRPINKARGGVEKAIIDGIRCPYHINVSRRIST